MITYLDESYDNKRTWLLISALFNPKHKKFYTDIKRLLRINNYILPDGRLKEIKYVYCRTEKIRLLYQKVIDAFINSDSYFASVVIKTDSSFDLHRYGDVNEPDKVKRERAYRALAEHLLANELRNANDTVLFLDKMTRCEPKQFLSTLKQNFCVINSGYSEGSDKPRIKHIQDVVSDAEGYELMGVCDLLQGCILNNLSPIQKIKNKEKASLNKNLIREYLVKRLGVSDLTPDTWIENFKKVKKENRDKFNIRYVTQAKKTKSSG